LSAGSLTRIYLVGVGEQNLNDLRKAAAALGRRVKSSNSVLLSALVSDKKLATTAAVAFVLSNYQYSLKTDLKDKKPELVIYGDFEAEIERADVLASAVWQARDLIHTPSNIKNPEWLAKQATAMVSEAKSSSLSLSIKSGRAIKDFGGLVAVGNSSPNPGPRLIELTYAPKGSSSWPHVVLVGKGITFDTGGVSLKRPYDTMIGMKSDMAGAAAVLCATVALARIKPKVKVTTLLMVAENALSGTAQRPSDVIKHYGGTTVEVLNTDAEGRLILADALIYAQKFNPELVIDLATLTGAAAAAIGKYGCVAMCNHKANLSLEMLEDLGNLCGDRVATFPFWEDYDELIKSDIAEIKNIGGPYGGAITAGKFLSNFVDYPWIHLDIAGPAFIESNWNYRTKGATGYGVRLLYNFLK
jgi:leucyl aminopeptidase